MTTGLVLDVDTGTDDAVAIMLAALHPELELTGISTVNGNVPVAYCTDNTLRVLDHIGADVPVHQGAATPLSRSTAEPGARAGVRSMHGLHLEIPETSKKPQPESGVEFLLDTYRGAAGPETVLVATGPLTNVALALAADKSIAERIPRLVIMGGSHEIGNVTPSAEFNIWTDPEAARAVLRSGIDDVLLIPLDCTHQALVTSDDQAHIQALGTPASEAAARFIARRIRAHDETQPLPIPHATPVHDAVCVASLVRPDVLADVAAYQVDVELNGELTRGRTVIDTHRRSGCVPNARVALGASRHAFVDFLTDTLALSLDS